MASRSYCVVFVTAPDIKTARKIAAAVLEARLAACANMVPGLESHYWWRGKLEKGSEVLMILKTTHACLPALEKCVLQNHPYDTPEFVVSPISSGSKRYLEWIGASVCHPAGRKKTQASIQSGSGMKKNYRK